MVKPDEPEKQLFAGRPGPDRPKGSRSRISLQLVDMVLDALVKAGGVDYLVGQAEANPRAFLALVTKVLPLKLNAEHAAAPRPATALRWLPPT